MEEVEEGKPIESILIRQASILIPRRRGEVGPQYAPIFPLRFLFPLFPSSPCSPPQPAPLSYPQLPAKYPTIRS